MAEGKKGFFGRLVEGLAKTRNNIVSGIDSIFSGFSAIDDDFYEEIEETLIMGDLGIQTTMSVLEDLRKKVKEQHIKEPVECKQLLIDSIREQMDLGENAYEFENRKSVVLVIGVNGVGKTTSVGKLAGQLKDEGKKVILAAADTFRAAAIEQLTEWANRAGVEIIAQQEGSAPAAVIYDAVAAAKSRQADVLICDTAGRLHIDEDLMKELKDIKAEVQPNEILLVVDSMTGQDAVNVAKSFNDMLDITGVILTKLDGDTRGGAALSVLSVTGKPIKFAGVGEKTDDLEQFHPNRMADRILGMGDVLSLIEKAKINVDEKEQEKLAKRLQENKFDMNDLYAQFEQIEKMGSISSLIKMIPGVAGKVKEEDIDERRMYRTKAIISSMTKKEREKPSIIDAKRKRRIAAGSGTKVEDVNQLLKQFDGMQKMMKQMGLKGGKKRKFPKFPMGGMGGMNGMGGFPM